MILVPTIPYTGTHFMRDHLLAGLETDVRHIWDNRMEKWAERIAAGHPIIVPLRHPINVAMSWKRREHLGGSRLRVMNLPDWWRRLSGMIDPARPYYLPLDLPHRREACLDNINKNLGLELATDWPVIREKFSGDYGSGCLDPEEIEVAVTQVYQELEPFFSRWYDPLPP